LTRRLLLPSIPDWLFLAVLAILLLPAGSGSGLLADGDVGWHIRTGDAILASGRIPRHDLFSFSRPGEPWFAWEWLSDVFFAAVHRGWGLHGVAVSGALLIALSAAILFRRLEWEGAGMVPSLGLVLAAVAASSVHYLARPHLFTYVLLPLALWLIESDRRHPSRRVLLLVPAAAVWANLHAGFIALPAALALEAAGECCGDRRRALRLAGLFGLTSLATLLNPYGYRLHGHILSYLDAGWIRDAVEEFQAPKFRSESSFAFLLLLFCGLIAVHALWRSGRRGAVANLLFWAQAALQSARHIPVYALTAAPLLAAAAGPELRRWTGERAGRPMGHFAVAGLSAGAALIVALSSPARFPDARFPVQAVEGNARAVAHRRVLTSDQWGDYLLYRFPGQKVFMDGRTDFYGREVAHDYTTLMLLEEGWSETLARHGFEAALLPREWPLAKLLAQDPGWSRVYTDRQASIFEKAERK
jgi:hypothetical protein